MSGVIGRLNCKPWLSGRDYYTLSPHDKHKLQREVNSELTEEHDYRELDFELQINHDK